MYLMGSEVEQAVAMLRMLEAGQVPTPFGHREHLQVAWYLLEAERRFSSAVVRLEAALLNAASAVGHAEKFHVTRTYAWMSLVAECRGSCSVGFEELLRQSPELLDKQLLERRYYSPQELASEAARQVFILPQREAIA